MSEVEKKESQKTVVAFISGLLIGGLLVWIFSSSPEKAVAPEETEKDTKTEVTNTQENKTIDTDTKTAEIKTGNGAISVSKQSAGKTVMIDSLSLPTANGWVVVRDYVDGKAGNILGAARYSVDEMLTPKTVELIRATEAGKTYQVVLFNNNGDKAFNLTEDTIIDGISTTFDAQ